MKIKKRYYVACILLCVLSIIISIAVFNLEMNLSMFSKLNDTISSSWANTEIFVTSVETDPAKLENPENAVSYLGKVTYITKGKYTAYGKDCYMGKALPYYGEVKIGDKVSVYYKTDDIEMLACKVPYTSYLIAMIILFVLDIALIVVARLLNRSLKENTFSEAPVSIMDIPICVLIIGFVICFFSGMLIGNVQIGTNYTDVNPVQVAAYEEEYGMKAPVGDDAAAETSDSAEETEAAEEAEAAE